MSIILRLDIDKPYGRATLPGKILSKVREDYWFPALNPAGYLKDYAEFLEFLNSKSIPSLAYHRICTAPSKAIEKLLMTGKHKFGLHAEDTRSLATLKAELEWLGSLAPGLPIHSFTKHGSGELKLGRRHYSPYEPEKYLDWSRSLKVPFLFGNGIAQDESAFTNLQTYYPDMFWFEPEYQSAKFNQLDQVLGVAQNSNLVVIIHPENVRAIPAVKKSLMTLIDEAKQRQIQFTNELAV